MVLDPRQHDSRDLQIVNDKVVDVPLAGILPLPMDMVEVQLNRQFQELKVHIGDEPFSAVVHFHFLIHLWFTISQLTLAGKQTAQACWYSSYANQTCTGQHKRAKNSYKNLRHEKNCSS